MEIIKIQLLIIFFSFMVVKASNNALLHDYPRWRQRFGIPAKWDFYFNPAISHLNKYKSKIWNLLTPFSDIWHTLWTLWQFYFVYVLIRQFGFWEGMAYGVGGVFIVFNGLYNFLRYKKFINL